MKSKPLKEFELGRDKIAREGARQMLAHALDLEDYFERFKDEVDEDEHRFVVRNVLGCSHKVTMGQGIVDILAPRGEEERSFSKVLPPYLHKSPKVESLLPIFDLTDQPSKFTLIQIKNPTKFP